MIARKCDKTSLLGKYLDVGADCLYSSLILVLAFIKISNKYWLLKLFIGFAIIISPTFYLSSVLNNYDTIDNKLMRILHDNTILVTPLFSILLYYLSIKLK